MSRFDLFFIVTDDCSEVSDYNIARHIVMNRVRDVCATLFYTREVMGPRLHTEETNTTCQHNACLQTPVETPYTKEEMQMYIAYARTLNPMV